MLTLDCEIYSPGKRAATTEKVYEAIKNCEISGLDLLVREMIQNSLDAALDNDKSKTVSVFFTRGDFDVKAFAGCLGKAGVFHGANYSRLLLDYVKSKKPSNRYLAIRDVGCVGLDGEVTDRNSRAWKLPFGFYDGQDSDLTTGGANGVGKVVAFRFGIGFVVYYSKIKDGRSRFVIAFMDDGTHGVFPRKVIRSGAAWWGKKSKDPQLGVVCVEKESDIAALLTIFKIAPYKKGLTGTTIIIPFFDEKACLSEVMDRQPREYCPWVQDFDSCIGFCINQWYAPRLRGDATVVDLEKLGNDVAYHWGRSLKIPQLGISHNHPSCNKVFSLIRELYDVAVGDREPDSGTKRITCPMRRNAPKQGVYFQGESIGWVAVKKINYKTGEYFGVLPVLCALIPGQVDDESGQRFLERIGTRRGFMLYCRQHGMIVSYERDWDEACYSSLPKPQDGEFYIGIFVVDSRSTVMAPFIKNESHTAPIDVIFKSFEKTDHYRWPRKAAFGRMAIISLLLNQIKSRLREAFQGGDILVEREPLDRLSALLGRFMSFAGSGFGDGLNPSAEGVGGVPGMCAVGGGTSGRSSRVVGGRHGGTESTGRIRFRQGAPSYELVDHQTIVSIPVTITFLDKELCAAVKCGIVKDGDNSILEASDFSSEDIPVAIVAADIAGTDAAVSVAVNKEALVVEVSSVERVEVTMFCRYALKRKDIALAIDCDAVARGSVL